MREARQADASLQAPLLGRVNLGTQQVVEEVRVGGLALLGSLKGRRQSLGGSLQLQTRWERRR